MTVPGVIVALALADAAAVSVDAALSAALPAVGCEITKTNTANASSADIAHVRNGRSGFMFYLSNLMNAPRGTLLAKPFTVYGCGFGALEAERRLEQNKKGGRADTAA
ncbi:MAG: hypothetical protein ACREQN_06045 [Candidatus Binataceae bacterium]